MDQVEEVKQKVDIVKLIGERIKLVKAGRNFKALCPFHSERTPSFMVSVELQIYKCFGCGKGGDVYSFLKEFEGMEFPEALAFLAKQAGVQLREFKKDRGQQRKDQLREINHLTSEYYHYLLTRHGVGKKALRYLGERGIRKTAIEAFKLGYAADSWDGLVRYLVGKKRYRREDVEGVGLVVKGRRRVYDRFRNRLVFPLRDVRGNVVGFAGRVLPGYEGQGGKYINSPETELYHKSKHLFGLYENRESVKRKDQVVAMEGELDVISSWQAGVKQVVAVKGTAVTKEQVELMRRYSRNLVLALDADAAGDAATKRSISLADMAGMNIKVVILTGGKDPDEISQSDPKKWREMVSKARSVYDFYLTSVKSRFDLKSGLGKKQASEEIIPVLAKISNSVEQAHYVKKMAGLLDVSEDSVIDEIRRFERTATVDVGSKKEAKEPEKEKDRREVLEEYLLALLLQGGKKTMVQIADFSVDLINQPAIRRIVVRFLKMRKEKYNAGVFISSLAAELQGIAQSAFLADVHLNDESLDFDKELTKVKAELVKLGLREELDRLSASIQALEGRSKLKSAEDKELLGLRREFSEVSQKLSGIGEK